jgi:hypothetical protein
MDAVNTGGVGLFLSSGEHLLLVGTTSGFQIEDVRYNGQSWPFGSFSRGETWRLSLTLDPSGGVLATADPVQATGGSWSQRATIGAGSAQVTDVAFGAAASGQPTDPPANYTFDEVSFVAMAEPPMPASQLPTLALAGLGVATVAAVVMLRRR